MYSLPQSYNQTSKCKRCISSNAYKLGRQYGFCTFTNYQDTQSGRCLKAIKGRRNDLAHGTYSFTEIGKEYTIEDLGRMKNEAIKYLAEIIQNIELYLNSKSYILPEYIEH